jgi:two-component system, response regulator PdtaR
MQEEPVEQTRLIVADDELITREDLKEALEGLGYLVVGTAGDGKSAVNLARQLRPDAIIMDIRMPDMDGIDAAKILTEERIAPVVLVSGHTDKQLVQRAQAAGVVAYITKPYRPNDLPPAIEVGIARFQEFESLREENRTIKETLETRKLVDRAKGILMVTQGLNEADAFRKIQKMSMDTRRPMKDIAQALIITHEAEARTDKPK